MSAERISLNDNTVVSYDNDESYVRSNDVGACENEESCFIMA